MSISVLGAGAFGTALAITFGRTGSKVSLWGRDPNVMQSLATEQCNKKYLPNVKIVLHITIDP